MNKSERKLTMYECPNGRYDVDVVKREIKPYQERISNCKTCFQMYVSTKAIDPKTGEERFYSSANYLTCGIENSGEKGGA